MILLGITDTQERLLNSFEPYAEMALVAPLIP